MAVVHVKSVVPEVTPAHDPSRNFPRLEDFSLKGRLALPVFGLAPSLSCVASLETTGVPEDFALSAVQEREHLPQGGLVLTLYTPRYTR